MEMLADQQVPFPEMPLRAPSPAANEIVIQRAARGRAHQRHQTRRPLLRHLGARSDRDPLDDPRHKALDHFALEKFFSDIHAGGARRSDPQFGDFVLRRVLKAVNQAEFLNHSHREGREETHIRNDSQNSAHAEPHAFGQGDFRRCGDGPVSHLLDDRHR